MASRVMRAIRVSQFGGPEVLKIVTDVPVPRPQDKQVLIKVMTTGVNPVDTYIRAGTYANKPSLPYTPGNDASGVVEEVGSGVTKVKVGDRVYTGRTQTGSCAEYTVAEEAHTHLLHENLNFSQGATLGTPYYTAYRALITRARGKAGESVFVHGASGAVGIAACQIARAYGMTVFGTAGTPEGQCTVAQNGAHHVFSHKEKGYTDKIMAATGGKGVNVILEMLANVNLEKDLELLSRNGRVVVIGSRGTIEITPRLMMGKESQIMGVMLPSASPEEWSEMEHAIGAGMEAGWLKPVIGEEFPLEKASEAHVQIIEHAGGTKGKIILSI